MNEARKIVERGSDLFSGRNRLLSLWQETAEQFYPERADFQSVREMGDAITGHLSTSYPMVLRRDLSSMFSTMLRPRDTKWFEPGVEGHEEDDDDLGYAWLQNSGRIMRSVMADNRSGFIRATTECDNDYVTFGQGVLKIEMDWAERRILTRCRHLKDVVWREDKSGIVNEVHDRWKPTASELAQTFRRDNLHESVIKALSKEPGKTFECRHVVMPAWLYEEMDFGNTKFSAYPFVSIYVDVDNNHIIETSPSWTLKYVIPRWQTVSGSQYSYSPCALAGLPDARLLQSMTLTLLVSSEKYADPPVLVVGEALGSDLNLYAGGATMIEARYDQRTGDAVRTLPMDKGGFPAGLQMLDRTREALHEIFYLNKLTLPDRSGDMTAFETAQRIQEYIRGALPLFEPVENNYSEPVCNMIFEESFRAGLLGPMSDVPSSLKGKNVKFSFRSPLHDMEDRQKAEKFVAAKGVMEQAAMVDPASASMLDVRSALRDALKGMDIPSKWILSDDDIMEKQVEIAKAQEMEASMDSIRQAADIADKAAGAAQKIGLVNASS